MEYQCDQIMERIRERQSEFSEDRKENGATHVRESISEKFEEKSSPTKIFGSSVKVNQQDDPKTPLFKAAPPTEISPPKTQSQQVEQTSARKARFSALAQELDDFECDFQNSYNKPKEAYMKGKSPRLSIGETRPSVLCTPAGAASLKSPNVANTEVMKASDFEERRIKFAQPVANINFLPNESSVMTGSSNNDTASTLLGGSADMMNLTTSSISGEFSINQQITAENTIINAQSCDNREAIIRERMESSSAEYGAHTFMRKKVVGNENGEEIPCRSKSIHTFVSSPKPFSKDGGCSKFSPVEFTPKSTSSPKFSQSEVVFSPSKNAALESNKARTIKQQFEQKLQTNTNIPIPAPIPTPRHVISTNPTTPVGHVAPHQKPLFTSAEKQPNVPGGVQTQWRGKQNVAVVQGARAEEKTAGSEIVGAGVGKLKNLKSRWEFSSATGTPIHPDASEDSLLATAIRMKETAIPNKVMNRSLVGKKGHSASSMPAKSTTSIRSATTSPAAKNVRYEETDLLDDDVFEGEDHQNPETNEEMNPVAPDDHFDEESGDELASTDASRIIDQAFDFMERGSKMGTPSPYRPSLDGQAPLAQLEEMSSPRKRLTSKIIERDVIEEEDVPMGEDDDDDVAAAEEEHTVQGDGDTIREESRVEQEWNERKNDSKLPYSVSFYRKIRREKVADHASCSTPVEPSAPPTASLTSANVLQKLTTGDGNCAIAQDEMKIKERIKRAIKVEDEHISQSKRALALCRETPTFRGSREEIEMQRALLIAVEKQRALLAEFERIQRDGPRIVDGPRGEITVSQLQVNLSKEYVQSNIASYKKSTDVYFFVAILKWGEQVEVSKIVTSDAGINRKGVLDFGMPLQLREVPPDFRATIEIYGQKSQREYFSHEDKYKLKGSTLKTKSKNTTLGNSSVLAAPVSMFTVDSNYNLLGSFTFDIKCPAKKMYSMSHPVYPLDGVAMMKVKKRAVDGSDIVYNGFLSMYQRTREGLGCWTRYWCVLDAGEMKFWKHPEDEGTKNWLVLLDLSTCIRSDGASIVSDMCPYPNSFHIDVWVPKEDGSSRSTNTNGDIEQLRVMLAADTPADLSKWLSVINGSSRQLCTWRQPIA